MKTMRTRRKMRCVGPFAAVLCLMSACAWGIGAEGIGVPLYAGNIAPLLDEFGRPMRGSPSASAAESRSRVEMRAAYTNRNPYGEVFAPGIDGAASPYNPLVLADGESGMGLNTTADSGLFCVVFPKRPVAGTRIFARAFNAPTLEEATFYADSAPVEVLSNKTTAVFAFAPLKPLDPGDDDLDGLNNSWEQLLGIDDRPTADYDGDGMSDYHEMLAGTAPDDPDSRLSIRLVRRETTVQRLASGEESVRPVCVKWRSVPGKKYQLEYVPMLTSVADEPPLFVPVPDGRVTAGAGEYEISRWVDVEDDLTGTFRVKLVVE